MNTDEIRTLLAERAGTVDGVRDERADEVFGRIRTRQRRRTAAVVVGAAVVVLVLVAGGSLLGGDPERRSDPSPATSWPVRPEPPAPVRRVTYGGGYWPTTTIHYGDRTVDLPEVLSVRRAETAVVHMDVTDNGVVFTIARAEGEGRGVWFTDGQRTQRIGRISGYLGIRNDRAVVTGTVGSHAAWIETPERGPSEVVVYDTRADRAVARVPVPRCSRPNTECRLEALVAGDVYWANLDWMHTRPDALMRLDVATGRIERVTPADLAADRAAAPRALIVGDSLRTGVVGNGYGQLFAVDGRRLVPMRENEGRSDDLVPTKAFETGTGARLDLRLPAGYDGDADDFETFEWLDDDRLALMNRPNAWDQETNEILVCRISTGHCELAVPAGRLAPDPHLTRIVPHLGLPG